MGAVFVLGALHLDVVLNAPRLPRLDETLMGTDVRYVFGGKGGNQAVGAARMGATVAMGGRVGDDAFGLKLLAALDEAGVDAAQVVRGAGASGMSAAIVTQTGDYGAVVVSAANMLIAAGETQVPEDTSILCLQNEIPEAANIAAARQARQLGARVLLNAAPARTLSADLLALTDILVVNRVEGADLVGPCPAPEMVEKLRRLGPETTILTLGEGGLAASASAAPPVRLPARSVPVVSTHGAGDAFVGALAATLAEGADLRDALNIAQAAAALHISRDIEGRSKIRRADVEALLTGQSPNR